MTALADSDVRAGCIVLMRHAEKPEGEQHGVDERGHEDAQALSVRGWQRAGALVRWLVPLYRPAPFGLPAGLWAAASTPAHPSHRPALTLAPLARLLSEPVRLDLDPHDLEAAAATLLAQPGTQVVSWRHDDLPALAVAIARRVGVNTASVPAQWPADCFDQAWVFERQPAPPWLLGSVAQQLLDGDAE
jgi:hypothetical protein